MSFLEWTNISIWIREDIIQYWVCDFANKSTSHSFSPINVRWTCYVGIHLYHTVPDNATSHFFSNVLVVCEVSLGHPLVLRHVEVGGGEAVLLPADPAPPRLQRGEGGHCVVAKERLGDVVVLKPLTKDGREVVPNLSEVLAHAPYQLRSFLQRLKVDSGWVVGGPEQGLQSAGDVQAVGNNLHLPAEPSQVEAKHAHHKRSRGVE